MLHKAASNTCTSYLGEWYQKSTKSEQQISSAEVKDCVGEGWEETIENMEAVCVVTAVVYGP